MRYHATVHDHGQKNAIVFECHVVADDTGAARVKLQAHLKDSGEEDLALLTIVLVEVRCDIVTPLPVIE